MERPDTMPNVFDIINVQLFTASSAMKSIEAVTEHQHRIILMTEGKAIIHDAHSSDMLDKGELIALAPGTGSISFELLTESAAVYCIEFAAARGFRDGDNWRITDTTLPLQGRMQVHPLSIAHHRMDELFRCWHNEPSDSILLQIRFQELWQLILSGVSRTENQPNTKAVLRNIREHMDKHFIEQFQVEEIARFSGMTSSAFYEQFKEYTSLSPLQYITHKRVEQARRLLLSEKMKIQDVAQMVGYNDVCYFSRAFKKTTGLSPSHYVKSLSKKIAVIHPALFGNLLALGVPAEKLVPLWNDCDHKSPYRRNTAGEFNLDKLRREEPDFIIGTDHAAEWHDELAAIAPTHFITFKPFTWREHFTQLAAIIGVEEVAEQWLFYYDLKTAAAQRRIRKKMRNETVLAARISNQGVRVFGANRRKIGKFLYGELQLNAPESTYGFTFTDLCKLEQLNEFRADHILLFRDQGQAWRGEIPLQGNIHLTGIYPWFHYSALGHVQALDEALIHFADATSGGLYNKKSRFGYVNF
ncbi:AraC family transcriptional regulator [Paenibacillus profundus]|uniref:AraC family transcriptional regulator n=1 Tax=Paenibacillus profundus TaxID=1173085 RepID=A0ABS8YIK9_9BACL|nr:MULTISPECIES: AraC family transcriptional regulator [Paenibacillus]MCE5171601.1 AraC family transcriptional regulator [Paenibacillus profundus]